MRQTRYAAADFLFILAFMLVWLTKPALAQVSSHITTGPPTQSGSVQIRIKDTNLALPTLTTTTALTGTETAPQKAAAIKVNLDSALAADALLNDSYTTAITDNTVTISKQAPGGLEVQILSDTTGQGGALRITDSTASGGSGSSGDTSGGGGTSGASGGGWFWRLFRWFTADLRSPVPAGRVISLELTNGSFASITGDGSTPAAGYIISITEQLEQTSGGAISFTGQVDPTIHAHFLVSNLIPVEPSFPLDGVGVASYSPGYTDFFGGLGLQLVHVAVPEPASAGLLLMGACLGFSRRRRTPAI